ncbi:MAG: MBL fold metallo-hydrolase RNA specificity domain-containing protein [Ktedonobacteraceae bacterium]
MAEHRRDTLELDGRPVPVQCHVATYSLSAHADGGELAAYAATIKPRHVALVHGDEEARVALRIRLVDTKVCLPENGTMLSLSHQRAASAAISMEVTPLLQLPTGIGAGQLFTRTHLEQLWQAVSRMPALRIVTARELALVWSGTAR